MTCALLIGLLLAYVVALVCLVGFVVLGVPHITIMLWHSIKSIAIHENHKMGILMCDECCEAPFDALSASDAPYKQLLKVGELDLDDASTVSASSVVSSPRSSCA